MPGKKRLMALVLAGTALTLTVIGVVLAATDPNPGGVLKDPFTLNGYPPKTVDLSVTLTSDQGFGLSATVQANFTTGRVAADVSLPLDVETAAFDLRLAKDHLYARSADESSGPWLETHLTTPSLFGVSLELTKPDVDLIKGFHTTVTRSGYLTTYTFVRKGVALTKLFGSRSSNATLGTVNWTVTVGSQGEFVSSVLRETTSKGTTTLSARVLSYNQPASISVPAAGDTQRLSGKLLKKLLGSEDFTSIVFPKSLTSLAGTSVN